MNSSNIHQGHTASVLVLCSKAQARYGLDMHIQRTWKSRSDQSKDSVGPLEQGLSAVLSCRLDFQRVNQKKIRTILTACRTQDVPKADFLVCFSSDSLLL